MEGTHRCSTTLTQIVLELAVNRGYYEDGAEITLKQLADELGIARSTTGEHLKRAESEVLKRAINDFQ